MQQQQLEQQFIRYKLANVNSLTTTESIRIYELLIEYLHVGERCIG